MISDQSGVELLLLLLLLKFEGIVLALKPTMDSNEYCSKFYQLIATINEKPLQGPGLSIYFLLFKYHLLLALPNSLKDKLIILLKTI